MEIFSVSRQSGPEQPRNHSRKVLVLVPAGDNLSEFRRVGVGDVWLQSFREDENMGTTVKETFKGIEKCAISYHMSGIVLRSCIAIIQYLRRVETFIPFVELRYSSNIVSLEMKSISFPFAIGQCFQ